MAGLQRVHKNFLSSSSSSIDRDASTPCCCNCRCCSGTADEWEEHGCCARLCQTARALWLQDGDGSRMKQVEELYSQVWSRERLVPGSADDDDDDDDADADPQVCKKARLRKEKESADDKTKADSCCYEYCCPGQRQQAGEKLALIFLQSNRAKQADEILVRLGFTCRLARSILDYNSTSSSSSSTLENVRAKETSESIPCCIYDDVLSNAERNMLQSVFLDPTNSYWVEHNYTVEPPSPYFSYLLPLSSQPNENGGGGLGRLVYRLRDFLAQHHSEQFPNVGKAQYVELWAHNRPHATGHQFHFDSDNEGCTGAVIRNPICSCVLFLTDGTAGGPSLVTNQRLASRHLANRGWMCPAAVNRLLVFDGKVLHGVIPGKQEQPAPPPPPTVHKQTQPSSARRVTVMLAFWRRIRVRDNEEGPGAARLLPTQPDWAQQLRAPPAQQDPAVPTTGPVAKQPISVGAVYESVHDGTPWTRQKGLPDYEQMFQGF